MTRTHTHTHTLFHLDSSHMSLFNNHHHHRPLVSVKTRHFLIRPPVKLQKNAAALKALA